MGWVAVDGVPHARLVNRSETLKVAVCTLADPYFFAPALDMPVGE